MKIDKCMHRYLFLQSDYIFTCSTQPHPMWFIFLMLYLCIFLFPFQALFCIQKDPEMLFSAAVSKHSETWCSTAPQGGEVTWHKSYRQSICWSCTSPKTLPKNNQPGADMENFSPDIVVYTMEQRNGNSNLRLNYLECTQVWVYASLSRISGK